MTKICARDKTVIFSEYWNQQQGNYPPHGPHPDYGPNNCVQYPNQQYHGSVPPQHQSHPSQHAQHANPQMTHPTQNQAYMEMPNYPSHAPGRVI